MIFGSAVSVLQKTSELHKLEPDLNDNLEFVSRNKGFNVNETVYLLLECNDENVDKFDFIAEERDLKLKLHIIFWLRLI